MQVDFIDSKLSPDETRNAIIQACSQDFAMVGTTALFLNNVDDMMACKDQAGAATGLPDVPQLTTDPTHVRATVSFPTIISGLVQSDPTNSTWKVGTGQFQWFIKNIDKNLHGTFGTAADLKSTQIAGLVGIAGAGTAGIKKDLQFDSHGTDPQDKYLPWAQAIKDKGSTYATVNSNDVAMAYMRKEAQIQGVSTVKVWDCTIACYTPRFLAARRQRGRGPVHRDRVRALRGGQAEQVRRRVPQVGRRAGERRRRSGPRPGCRRCSSATRSRRSSPRTASTG